MTVRCPFCGKSAAVNDRLETGAHKRLCEKCGRMFLVIVSRHLRVFRRYETKML